jgi:heptaprenylglyceryl phosphate synthase
MISIFRVVLASFFIIAVQPLCFAQTVAQSRAISAKLEKTTSELLLITTNLNEINVPNLPDFELISNLNNSAVLSYHLYAQLLLITSIHFFMIDPKDQNIVRGYVLLSAKGAIAIADTSTRYINQSIARLKTQAAISELIKARDFIQLMRTDASQLIPAGK